jgi:hypothetical protein
MSRVTLTFARVGWLSASSGAESVITKPAIDFVNVSVRTALFPALSVAVIVIVCFAFVSAVKVFPETESVCVAPSRDRVLRSRLSFRRSFQQRSPCRVRIGYAVLIGEIGALDPKIGITAGNHGRLVMNYGNISACGVRGIIA